MSLSDELPRFDDERPDVNSRPDAPDESGDIPSSPTGVGIGASSEPDTFEPEEPSE